MTSLTINGNTVDLTKVKLDRDITKPGYILLQLKRDVTKAEKEDVLKHGIRLIEYVGSNTYICDYIPPKEQALFGLKTEDYVKDVFFYHSDFRKPQEDIHPETFRLPKKNAKDSSEVAQTGLATNFAIVLHEGGKVILDQVAADVEKFAAPVKIVGRSNQLLIAQQLTTPSPSDQTAHKQDQERIIQTVLAMPGVRVLEALPMLTASLNYAREILKIDRLQPPAAATPSYLGEGEVITIADSGLDTGAQVMDAKWSGTTGKKTDTFIDPFYSNEDMFRDREIPKSLDGIVHPSFVGRVAAMAAFTPATSGSMSHIADQEGHGTFIAGCASSNPIAVVEPLEREVVKTNPKGQPVNVKGEPLINEKEEPLFDERGTPLFNDRGQPINKIGQPLTTSTGQLVDSNGNPVNDRGQLINIKGEAVDSDNLPINAQGQPLNEKGQPLTDSKGQLIDRKGRRVNDKGLLINEKGQVVNAKGELLVFGKGKPAMTVVPVQRFLDKNALVQGAAPSAKLFILAFHWAPGMTNLEELFLTEYKAADGKNYLPPIHNNSWNSVPSTSKNAQLGYGFLTGRKVDEAMARHPEILICFAAGNDGRKWGNTGAQISGVAAAKNCITVGASRNLRNAELADDRYYSQQKGTLADPSDVADFSCRGPTTVGRIKPDVVAPGACLLAPRSMTLTKNKDDSADLLDDKRFTVSSGTSCAAPIVSGCAAILRQAYIPELVATALEQKVSRELLALFGFLTVTPPDVKTLAQNAKSIVALNRAAVIDSLGLKTPLTKEQEQKVDEQTATKAQAQIDGAKKDHLKAATLTNDELRLIHLPSGAMLKALLIHGTDDLTGHFVSMESITNKNRRKIPIPKAPNGIEGFGRVNVKTSIRSLLARTDECGGVRDWQIVTQGEQKEVAAWSTAKPQTTVWVTLTWTDPPGEALQNYMVLKLVHIAATTNTRTEIKAEETQEWRASLNDPRDKLTDAALASPVAENNVQKVIGKNLPPGRISLVVTCLRTNLYDPTAAFSLVWSTSTSQSSLLDKAADTDTVKDLTTIIKKSLAT